MLDGVDSLLTQVQEMDKQILAKYEPVARRTAALAAARTNEAHAAAAEEAVLQKMEHILQNPNANAGQLISILQQTGSQESMSSGDAAALQYTIDSLAAELGASNAPNAAGGDATAPSNTVVDAAAIATSDTPPVKPPA